MDPATIAGIAAPVIGGLIGGNAARHGAEDANKLNQRALEEILRIQIPGITEQELQLLLPEYIGGLTAQTEGAFNLGPSAMEGVAVDPRLESAQMAALEQIAEIGQTGMTPGEAAALRSARRGAASEAQAKSEQIMQEMQRRGVGGSGQELAMRLQTAQSGADRMSQESDRAIQMAQERALQGLTSAGQLSSNIRGQQFGEQSDVARARDAINQFNTQNQQQVQGRNVASANRANERNLSEQQRISEARGATQNQQQQHNKNLIQQQFSNRMDRAAALSGQYTNQAKQAQTAGANQGEMFARIGSAVGTGLGGLAKKNANDDAYMQGAWDSMED